MSHTVVMTFAVDDKGCLHAAALALGLEYHPGQTKYRTYPRDGVCDDAISVPNNKTAYEIGVKANKLNGFDLLWDEDMAGEMLRYVGVGGERLQQEYAAQVTYKQYELDGFSVSRSMSEDGRILLEATRL